MAYYRIQEVKHDGKWMWTAQYRQNKDHGRWYNCRDPEGNEVYRDYPSSARHWLFWEDGYRNYPEAGSSEEYSAKCYDRNGKRWMSDEEKLRERRKEQNRLNELSRGDERVMKDLNRELILFVCDCGDVNHQFVVTLDHYDNADPEVFVEVKLNPLPFWKRLVHGIKYIFGYKSRFGDFGEITLNKTHVDGLEKVVNALKTIGE